MEILKMLLKLFTNSNSSYAYFKKDIVLSDCDYIFDCNNYQFYKELMIFSKLV